MAGGHKGKPEISWYLPKSTKTDNCNPRRTLSRLFFVIPERLVSIRTIVLAFTAKTNTLNYIYKYTCTSTSMYTYIYSVVHCYVVHRHHCANLALQAQVSNSIGSVCNSVHYVLWWAINYTHMNILQICTQNPWITYSILYILAITIILLYAPCNGCCIMRDRSTEAVGLAIAGRW